MVMTVVSVETYVEKNTYFWDNSTVTALTLRLLYADPQKDKHFWNCWDCAVTFVHGKRTGGHAQGEKVIASTFGVGSRGSALGTQLGSKCNAPCWDPGGRIPGRSAILEMLDPCKASWAELSYILGL